MTELLNLVNDYLGGLRCDRQPATLYDPIDYALSMGGKRLRPVLMLLAYKLYRDNPEQILPQAIGLETYHNFTLLHDDLMDNADVRRGHPTVHRRWNANTAILSGDTMQLMAYERITTGLQGMQLRSVLDLFTETALEIGEGQQMDMDFESRSDVAVDEYIEMIRLKTSVLLACAVKMGAMLAGASEADQRQLYQFGEQLGLAFQLQDDLLDVYGDPAVFGKAVGGDIMADKKTYMLISAFNRADSRQRSELEKWVGKRDAVREAKVAAVTHLYDELGIRELCEEKIAFYFTECQKSLSTVDVADERKQPLRTYISELMSREK